MLKLRNRGQFIILSLTLLFGVGLLCLGVSTHPVGAESILIAKKKKSTKPKIDSIISETDGYTIKGSGFGNKKNNIQVYEGRSPISSSSISSVKKNAIEVRRKPGQKVEIYVSRGNLSSNTYGFQWVDPALAKRKTEQITELKKTDDIQQMLVQEQQIKGKTETPTIEGPIKMEEIKKGEEVRRQIKEPPQLEIPTKKPPDKDDGGIHPIGRPTGEESEGGTMGAFMTHDDANCLVCHNVFLQSDPFWNWQTEEGDDTVRYVKRKKWFPNPPEILTQLPPAYHHAETDPGRFPPITSSNSQVVGLGQAADTATELRQRILIRSRGATTINWGGYQRTITVLAAPVPDSPATGIQSFTIEPNSVTGGQSATATAILNGTLEFGGRRRTPQ